MANYRVNIRDEFAFQENVKDKDLVTSPAAAKGDRYIIAGVGGQWAAFAVKDIVYCSTAGDAGTAVWQKITPSEGFTVYVDDENKYYTFDGASWTVDLMKGPQGDQGDTGAQGTQGTQGNQGDVGAQGNQGTQGNQGDTGAQGSTGAQGTQGNQGDTGAQGATGAQGTQGNTGAQGSTGAQGAQGDQGDQGVQGAQGPDAEYDSDYKCLIITA